MGTPGREPFRSLVVALVALTIFAFVTPRAGAATSGADATLQHALDAIVKRADGPPGISVVVQRASTPELLTAGVADTTTHQPIGLTDAVRMASVAKAFSGAAAVSAVADGKLQLDDTIAKILPKQPAAWGKVTLAQLLQHTSGVPDFSDSPEFRSALQASLATAPPPEQLLTYVATGPLQFTPGSQYEYSNSDNILVGLMVAAVDGRPYEDSLAARVYEPLALTGTSLPAGIAMPTPFVHGYQPDPPIEDDVTEVVAAGWAWASGGVVSTPHDANLFARGYASGKLTDAATYAKQFAFRPGSSEPPGPGTNAAGLAIFRYRTPCGTVYGHTGNTFGFTQFIAATRDGKRSTVVTINSQLTQKNNPKRFAELRRIYGLAVCSALQ
jgi:D-alanyl-D-alanine carboxypeptidase